MEMCVITLNGMKTTEIGKWELQSGEVIGITSGRHFETNDQHAQADVI